MISDIQREIIKKILKDKEEERELMNPMFQAILKSTGIIKDE